MIPHLTEEMCNALRQHPDSPISVFDPQTQATYILLPAETYERVRALLYDDTATSADELLPLAHEAFQQDWDAPGMEQYDEYDTHKPSK